MAYQFNQGDRPLPGYTIQRGVGRGGFGEVYYATSDGGKEVALKYLRENPQIELRGVTHCLNLKSPYLVAIHDIKQNAEGDSFVVMEYVNGPSLRDLMNSETGGLGPQKAAYFLREIGKGLAYLHDRGIVHRDLKPGNIFYEDGYVKIGDYGLAKIMASSQHSGQTVSVGTVHYMAPEVGGGNYDRTIDIYSMGVMLYEMLLGRVPYSGATMGEVLMKHLTAQPEVDELPEPFPRVIRKALAKDPKERYQTINEMVAELFEVEDIDRSVASFDTLGLTRMAKVAAAKAQAHAAATVAAAGNHGLGSSNVAPLGRTPPVIVQPGGRGATAGRGATVPPANRPFWEDFKDRPFGIRDATNTFPQRTRLATGLLGVFFGQFGIHRFYTGHNRIGLYQILATCITGVGALWGMIEGLQILLNGDFRDVHGRPLLERAERRRPGERSKLARVLWGVGAFLFLGTAVGLTLGGTLAPAAWEVATPGVGGAYAVNMMHLMYVFAPVALALGAFSVWKASHRGDLPAWRRTQRPALLSGLLGSMGVALTLELFFLNGGIQVLGIVGFVMAAVGFFGVWVLRGPDIPTHPHDAYWGRALALVFAMVGVLALFGAGRGFSSWSQEGRSFENRLGEPESVSVRTYSRNRNTRRYEYDEQKRPRILMTYNHTPLIAGACLLLAFGAFSETRYRWRRAVRIEETGPDQRAA